MREPSYIIRRQTPRRSRVPFYDNVKFLLITCVVVGHLVKLGRPRRRRVSRAFVALIYSFHMPLFVFISGLFVNRSTMTRRKTIRHVSEFFLLGWLAKFLRAFSPWLLGGSFDLSLFREDGVPWYMFAIATYYAAAWLLRSFDYRKVGAVSVMLALVVGYIPWVNDVLCLSRIIVFFPFFWLGHMLRPREVERFFAQRKVRVVCGVTTLIVVAIFLYKSRFFYVLRKLFMGNVPYASVGTKGRGWVDRLFCYELSIITSSCVLGLVSHRRLRHITIWGTRTLQVYLLHYEVIDVLKAIGVITLLRKGATWGWVRLSVLGVIVAVLLSIPNIKRFLKELTTPV